MITKDELFQTGDHKRIWQKYCGFLDLTLAEFMEIQEQLLTEQIDLVHDSPLGKKFMPRKPKDVSEFRQLVPLTTYEDYADHLGEKKEDILAVKPCFWAHTSGRTGSFKWVPYTLRAYEKLADNVVATAILACATKKGEVNIKEGMKVLFNIPPRPYITGHMAFAAGQRLPYRAIPPLDLSERLDFHQRIEEGFKIALRTGVDIAISISSVMAKIGEGFTERSRALKFSPFMLHPVVFFRLIRAWLRAKIEKRPLLPKDLWPLKGIIAGGIDDVVFRKQVQYYWGGTLWDMYVATETGYIAMENWNKKAMSFVPSSGFFEFIPEEEWLKSRENKSYQPKTVLLDEVKAGKRYEMVVSNFYGMPFLRYRVGDLIKIISLEDEETGCKLPQMVFESRADDIIDLAGFARLDEKTIWQAIIDTGLRHEDWTIRKEYARKQPALHLYIELKEERDSKEVEGLVHNKLSAIDRFYKDADSMLGIGPPKVTVLSQGTFQRYIKEKQAAGFDLAHLKPAHVNAADTVIQDLLRLSGS